jgi:DNA polymerase-3 subunit delta'
MPFSDFHGNQRIVAALRGALRTARVPHTLLFTGPRGLGKFTLARMFAQAANCERMTDDFCGACDPCRRIGLLAQPEPLIAQGLTERGESADASLVERMPLILQTHPDVWALVPDPVRLRTPVARPMLRIGQIRAMQRAAYFAPQGKRRVFILDGAETMRWDVANVCLKILEEPPESSTLILLAPSPTALLLTIVSRCLQFHFAPLETSEVEELLRKLPPGEQPARKPAEMKLAAQLSEGSPGLAMAMDVEAEMKLRRDALRILECAARGQGFAQLFAETSALAKSRETSFDQQLAVFYMLLTDLLELTAGLQQPQLRNPVLARELEALSRAVDTRWVQRAIAGMDELAAGARRNLNRQLGLDALATELAAATPARPSATPRLR